VPGRSTIKASQLGLDPAYVCPHGNLPGPGEGVCHLQGLASLTRDLANGDVEAGMRSYCLNAPTIVGSAKAGIDSPA
jgi:hypothetical protein